jgi:hypothetical protein
MRLKLAVSLSFALSPMSWGFDSVDCDTSLRPDVLKVQVQGQTYHLVDLEFKGSKLIPPHVHCKRWVEELLAAPGVRESEIEIRPLWGGVENAARLAGVWAPRIYERCEKSSICQVKFPYRLKYKLQRWFMNDSWRISSASKPAESCAEAPEPRVEKLQTVAVQDLSPIRVDVVPWNNPMDQALEVLRSATSGPVLISGMAMSVSQLERLVVELRRRPKLEVYLMLDFLVSAADPELDLFQRLAPPNLHIHYASRSPKHPKAFHQKVAVDSGGSGLWMLSSGNYKSYEDSSSLDLNLLFKDFDTARDLAGLWVRLAQSYCDQMSYLECSLNARFSSGARIKNDVRGSNSRFCSALANNPKLKSLGLEESGRYFYWNHSSGDLRSAVSAFVGKAQKSLVGFADRWDDKSLLDQLEKIRSRGPELLLWQGAMDGTEEGAEVPLLDEKVQKGLRSHAKGWLRDDDSVFLTTANMTENGLVWNEELGLESRNKIVVETIQQLTRSFFPDWKPMGSESRIASKLRVMGPKPEQDKLLKLVPRAKLRVRTQDWMAELELSKAQQNHPACQALGTRLVYFWNSDLEKCLKN